LMLSDYYLVGAILHVVVGLYSYFSCSRVLE